MIVDLVSVLVHPVLQTQSELLSCLFDHITLLSDHLSHEARGVCLYAIRNRDKVQDARIEYLLGYPKDTPSDPLRLASMGSRYSKYPNHLSPGSSIMSGTPSTPFVFRKWEMVQDATPHASENDTSLNMTLFGARKALM